MGFFLSYKILNVFFKSYFVYKCFPSNYTHSLLFFEQCTTDLIPFGSLHMPWIINVNTDNQKNLYGILGSTKMSAIYASHL